MVNFSGLMGFIAAGSVSISCQYALFRMLHNSAKQRIPETVGNSDLTIAERDKLRGDYVHEQYRYIVLMSTK